MTVPPTTTVTATQASRSFAAVLERAKAGERFSVTKNGEVVAQILPPERPANGAAVLAFFADWEGGAFDADAESAVLAFRDPIPSDLERLAWAEG
ncbi:MAG: type II toxin-antitoxin system prevent-host-death family antitoxin [Bifidobacteriaceae bacterium]|jgi:prevent-host-death family protein|nr:type II toxin-antitoxin system prevent-host-death family antitoxin [Bifidobacteriaceae bacterium]